MKLDIVQLVEAGLGIVNSFKGQPMNVNTVLQDTAAVVKTLHGNDPSSSGILADIEKYAATEKNLESGQAAEVARIPASFNGQADTVVVFALRQNAAEGSPAKKFLTDLGL